jgi:hypothetical protein
MAEETKMMKIDEDEDIKDLKCTCDLRIISYYYYYSKIK